MYFARHGYAFAVVDVRGRGNSDGEFEPFANDARDGHDVVEWLAKQPWCNGQVATWGGSYAGFNQWAILKEFPPHLSTTVPAAAAHPGIDFPMQQNIFGTYDVRWLAHPGRRTPERQALRATRSTGSTSTASTISIIGRSRNWIRSPVCRRRTSRNG